MTNKSMTIITTDYSRFLGFILGLVLGLCPDDSFPAELMNRPLPYYAKQVSETKNSEKPGPYQTYLSPEEAAQSSLAILKSPGFFRDEIGGNERAIALGFESIKEVSEAVLGQPLPVVIIGLDQLSHFQPNDNPNDLITKPHTFIFPLYVKSAVRSSLTVFSPTRTNDWMRMGRGSPTLIRTIERLRAQLHQPGDTSFLIINKGIGLRLLARKTNDTMLLTPIDDFTFGTLALKVGEERPANDVFSNLLPIANRLLESRRRTIKPNPEHPFTRPSPN